MQTAERSGAGCMLIEIIDLKKRYHSRGSWIVDSVSFHIDRGETVGIMGESGSGKSTIGQIVAGLYAPTDGKLLFDGQELHMPYPGNIRRKIQILFQHPEVSFNPRMKLISSLKEPYMLQKKPFSEPDFFQYMEQFGIYPEHVGRFPSELSGGELQRMALARAMLMEPELLVLDEPTSMLDMVSQAQMIQLLRSLQEKTGISYLFISHDAELAALFCNRIYHLEGGKFLEEKT